MSASYNWVGRSGHTLPFQVLQIFAEPYTLDEIFDTFSRYKTTDGYWMVQHESFSSTRSDILWLEISSITHLRTRVSTTRLSLVNWSPSSSIAGTKIQTTGYFMVDDLHNNVLNLNRRQWN